MALFSLIPGFASSVAVAALAVPGDRVTGIPALIGAICAGAILTTIWPMPSLATGIRAASDGILKLGIICMGAGLPFSEVQALGPAPFYAAGLAIGVCILLALGVTKLLERSRLGLRTRISDLKGTSLDLPPLLTGYTVALSASILLVLLLKRNAL